MTLNPNQHAPSGEAPAGVGFGGMAAFDKSALLRTYCHAWRCVTLIETGLFNGAGSGMPVAATNSMIRYIAIDYQRENIEHAKAKGFEAYQGDSAIVLDDVLRHRQVETPCLFWLDAHAVYDWEDSPTVCPVIGELTAILSWRGAGNSIVLIDDLWGFGSLPSWPTLDELRELADRGPWERDEIEGSMRLTPC